MARLATPSYHPEIRPRIAISDFSRGSSGSSSLSADVQTDEVWRGLEGELCKRLKLSARKEDEGAVTITDKMLARCREYLLRAQGETKLWKVILDASAAQRSLLTHRGLLGDRPGSYLPSLHLTDEHRKEPTATEKRTASAHADEVALRALAKSFKSLADRIAEAHPDHSHEFLSYRALKHRGPEAEEVLFHSLSSSLRGTRTRSDLAPQIDQWTCFLSKFDKRQRHLLRDFLEKASRLLLFLDDLGEQRPSTQGDREFGAYLSYGPVGDLPLHLIYLHGVSVLCWDTVHDRYVARNEISLPYRSDLRWALGRCGGKEVEALHARWVKEGCVGPHMSGASMGMFTGETVLHIAIAQQREEVVERLLESKADVRAAAHGVFFAPSRIVPFVGSLDHYHYLVHYNQVGKRWRRVLMPLLSTQRSRRQSSQGRADLPMRRYYSHELRENASLVHTWLGGSALIRNEESGWYAGELPLSFAASVGDTAIMWHIVSHVKHEVHCRWEEGEKTTSPSSPPQPNTPRHPLQSKKNSQHLAEVTEEADKQTPSTTVAGPAQQENDSSLLSSARQQGRGERDEQEEIDGDDAIVISLSDMDVLRGPRGRHCHSPLNLKPTVQASKFALSVRKLRRRSVEKDSPSVENDAHSTESDSPSTENDSRARDGLVTSGKGRRRTDTGGVDESGGEDRREEAAKERNEATEGSGATEEVRHQWKRNLNRSFMVRPGKVEPEWIDNSRYHEVQKEAVSAFMNAQDSHGNTALHMAVLHNQTEAVDWIMENGGQRSFTLLNHMGLTPFTLAAYQGNADMFLHLVGRHMSEQMWTYGPVCSSKTNLALLDSFRIALPRDDKRASRPYSHDAGATAAGSWTESILELHADRNYRSALEVVVEHRVEGIFDSPRAVEVVKQLIHKKWSKFGRRQHLRSRLVPYLCFAVVFSAMISTRGNLIRADHLADATNLPRQLTPTRILTWTLELSLLVLGVPFLLRSAWVNKRVRVTDLDVNMDGVVDFQERVIFLFKNMSSALDLVSVLLMLLCVVLRILGSQQLEIQVLAVAIIIVWSNALSTLMPFEYVGSLVITIHEMLVGDVAKFMIIYVVLVMGFGQSFYLLLQGGGFSSDPELQSDVQCVDCDQHLGKMLLKLVWVSLGESDQMALIETMSAPNLAVGIHIVYVILSLLLLLNLIIAMMGDTFNRQNRQIEKHWFYPYAEMVLRYEKKLSRREQLRCRVGIQAHRDEEEGGEEDTEGEERVSGVHARTEAREPPLSWMYLYHHNGAQSVDQTEIRL